jgi:hypothetical protein
LPRPSSCCAIYGVCFASAFFMLCYLRRVLCLGLLHAVLSTACASLRVPPLLMLRKALLF